MQPLCSLSRRRARISSAGESSRSSRSEAPAESGPGSWSTCNARVRLIDVKWQVSSFRCRGSRLDYTYKSFLRMCSTSIDMTGAEFGGAIFLIRFETQKSRSIQGQLSSGWITCALHLLIAIYSSAWGTVNECIHFPADFGLDLISLFRSGSLIFVLTYRR